MPELGGVAARVDPAVAGASRAPQRDVGVTADQQRDRGLGRRADLAPLELQHVAVVLEPVAGHEAPEHVDHLVHARTAPFPRDVHRREVLGPRADPDAEAQAVVAEHGDARGLLGDEDDGSHRELQHEGREADAVRLRREIGDEGERLDDRLVLEEGAIAVGRVRIERVGLGREDQAVGHDEGVVAGLLGRLRERREEGGVAERLCIAEAHHRILPDARQPGGTDQCTRSGLRAIPKRA